MKKLAFFFYGLMLITGDLFAQCNSTCSGTNTIIGISAGAVNNSGFNTFIGFSAGLNNTVGGANTFLGANAGRLNTSGGSNTFIGEAAGENNTIGSDNTFIGERAGLLNTDGNDNTFLGQNSGANNTSGSFNTFLGQDAGFENTIGRDNIFIGESSGFNNISGSENTFVGRESGMDNIAGVRNTFLGTRTGMSNLGSDNTFLGTSAGFNNFNGFENTFIGQNAGLANQNGVENTFLGVSAGANHERGNFNTFIGNGAGRSNNGSGNVFLGYQAGSIETGSNRLYIANTSTPTPLVSGNFLQQTLNVNGSLGVGVDNPERPLHIRDSNAILRIDRDQPDPGVAIIRYEKDFVRIWKSFYIYTRATGLNRGQFVIADWRTQVKGNRHIPRFVIDNDGQIGLGVGLTPTAQLHSKGSLRLEDLPQGEGNALVIDSEGNVFVSQAISSQKNLEKKQQQLEEKIAQLETKLQQLQASDPSTIVPASLYANQPNPFAEKTSIRYFLSEEIQQAQMYVYDMQGRQIRQISLEERGEGEIVLEAGSLEAGIYFYALVADGKEVDLKRMLITE